MFRFLLFLPDRLSRITSGGKFIAEIDGLRFLAIFPVLIQHMSERLQSYAPVAFIGLEKDPVAFTASRGFIGVYIFFVISGFVLALPFAAHYLKGSRSIPLKNYFWRRVTRLEPPYILLMTFFFFVLVFLRSASFGELFPHYLASIFYLHNIIYNDFTPINPVAWSLEIEVQFYLVAPFLAALFFRFKQVLFRRGLLVVSLLGILLLQQYLGWYRLPMRLTLLGNLHLFLAGFLLADIFLVEWKDGWKKSAGWDVLLLFILPLPFFLWGREFFSWLVFPFLLLLVFVAVFKSRYFNRFFTSSWITAIGGMCYTIYLIHLPLAELLIRFTGGLRLGEAFLPNLLLQLAFYLPLTFVVSVFFFLFLEKPCMDKHWPQKVGPRFRKLLYKLRFT